MNNAHLKPSGIWDKAKGLIQDAPDAYLVVDDSVQEKPFGPKIALAQRQYSGSTHGLVNGINSVNLLHVDRDGRTAFPIDYAIYSKDSDGKTKNEHFREMITRAKSRGIKSTIVLFDAWYGSVENLKFLKSMGLIFYTTIKINRKFKVKIDEEYTCLSDYDWGEMDPENGIKIKLKELPFLVWLFKIVTTKGDIEWVITNDPGHNHDNRLVTMRNQTRWKIEELHRELKQNALSDRCQARSERAQRNHLYCAFMAVINLRYWGKIAGINPYQIKSRLRLQAIRYLFRSRPIELAI
jgi:SRSO17 transposase